MRTILGKLNGELLLNLAIQAAPYCSSVDAAVAYAAGSDHPLLKSCKEHQLRLNFFGLLDEDGAVSLPFLKELLAWGPTRATVRLVYGNFHPKVIWWRGYGAYIGSANLTHKAWFNNVEAGVFFDEAELQESNVGSDLEDLFEHLAKPDASVPVTDETIAKLESLEQYRRSVSEQQKKLQKRFEELFGNLPQNKGLAVLPARGQGAQKENKRLKRFSAEWMATLQLMRGLAREFHALKRRPTWVDEDAHPAIHFDQFLHAYYYDFVRGGIGIEEEDDLSGLEKVEDNFKRHRLDPQAALREAADWWAGLSTDSHGEEQFIREIAPSMQTRLSREAVANMDLPAFTEAFRNVNAFRMHARQVKNAEFGLPKDHHESMDHRVDRLCAWLWSQRSASGRDVRQVLEFVLWGTSPTDMEERLWLGVWGEDFRLSHFGQSSLGEAVGWARPDDYPPRNNRTNKALRALGHDVKLFSS